MNTGSFYRFWESPLKKFKFKIKFYNFIYAKQGHKKSTRTFISCFNLSAKLLVK